MLNQNYKKIQLLHLVQSLGVGGAEVLLFHYINALGKDHYKHYVYNFGHKVFLKDKLEAFGIPVFEGPKRKSIKNPIKFGIYLFSLIWNLIRFIKKNRIQIIHSHLSNANQLAVAVGRLTGIPAFPTIHSTMSFLDRRSPWDLRVHLVKAVNAVVYRTAVKVIAVSQEIKEIVQKIYGLPDSKVFVLKNGICIGNSKIEQVNINQELHISSSTLKIIAVGTLSYHKAFDVLIRAAGELKKRNIEDFIMLIVGEGEDRTDLEKLIHNLRIENHVKLLGIRNDVMGLMKSCDIFVMPSRYEGLSIAMIEAMACGLPVVASDAPGIRDYIKHKQNGLLFPIEDHKVLAEHMLWLIKDKGMRVELSNEARKSFAIEYNMHKNIKQLDLVYQKYVSVE